MAKCKHISHDNLRGTDCWLTGNSVSYDCGAPVDDDAAGECIPKQALRYLRGDRASFAGLTRADRELVMTTARTIGERAKRMGGLFALAGIPHPDGDTDSAIPKEEDEVTDLNSMTAAELLELAAKARAKATVRQRAERQASKARPAIEAERDRCMERVVTLNSALDVLDAGKAVDLKALGVKIGRAGKRQAADVPKKPSGWTPERRKRQGEILRAAKARKKAEAA